jgi:hypothetical protein
LPRPSRKSTAETVDSGICRHSAISAAVSRRRRNAHIADTRSAGVLCEMRHRATIDQSRRSFGAPAGQPSIDRTLGDASGLGRRRHQPRLTHHAIKDALTPDRTEQCSSVNLHPGLLEVERAWQLLSLQQGPDVS